MSNKTSYSKMDNRKLSNLIGFVRRRERDVTREVQLIFDSHEKLNNRHSRRQILGLKQKHKHQRSTRYFRPKKQFYPIPTNKGRRLRNR